MSGTILSHGPNSDSRISINPFSVCGSACQAVLEIRMTATLGPLAIHMIREKQGIHMTPAAFMVVGVNHGGRISALVPSRVGGIGK